MPYQCFDIPRLSAITRHDYIDWSVDVCDNLSIITMWHPTFPFICSSAIHCIIPSYISATSLFRRASKCEKNLSMMSYTIPMHYLCDWQQPRQSPIWLFMKVTIKECKQSSSMITLQGVLPQAPPEIKPTHFYHPLLYFIQLLIAN